MPLGCNANHAARDVTLSGGAPTGPPPELPPPPPCTYEVQEYIYANGLLQLRYADVILASRGLLLPSHGPRIRGPCEGV